MHPIARAVRCQLECRDGFGEIRGPGIKMLNARIAQQLGRKVAQERVHLGHRVGNRGSGREHCSAAALGEVTALHVHIQRAVTFGVRKPRYQLKRTCYAL
jgi:hypothetical protein